MAKDITPKDIIRRLIVEVTDPATGLTEIDSGWESVTGGGVTIEFVESPEAHTTTPGHKYIDTLTLRGPLTAGRKALCTWITTVAQGNDSRRSITIREILKDGSAGKTYTYHDCFPVRYVPPRSSAEGGPLYEEILVKPQRFDLK